MTIFVKNSNGIRKPSSILREALTSKVSVTCLSAQQLNSNLIAFRKFNSNNNSTSFSKPIFSNSSSKLNQQLSCGSSKNQSATTTSTTNSIHIPIKNYKILNMKWSQNEQTSCGTYGNGTQMQLLPSLTLSDDAKSICFHPMCGVTGGCFATSACRTQTPLKKNAYTYWEISLDENAYGTSVMIGLGTKSTALNTSGYMNLLGMDETSWGLSTKGYLWHNNMAQKFCEPFETFSKQNDDKETKSQMRIGCLFDGFTGRMAYFCNGRLLGIAFVNLPVKHVDLFPMCASTVARCVMRLECAYESFPSLKEMCRETLCNSTSSSSFLLNLPF